MNAALAIALSSTWLLSRQTKIHNITVSPDFGKMLTSTFVEGLKTTKWPGRSQTFQDSISGAYYHVDGAHTPLSMECCTSWFSGCCRSSNTKKVLIFNCHHERDVVKVLQPLLSQQFEYTIFCPSRSCRPSIVKVS